MAHPTVFGGATPPSANYQIANSVQFRGSAPTYMTRTFGALTNGAKATVSVWTKRAQMGGNAGSVLFNPFVSFTTAAFAGGADHVRGDGLNGAGSPYAYTNAAYRDPSAWMHICISYDGTLASGQRNKIYVNGVLQSMYSNADGYAVLTDPSTNGAIGAGYAAMLGYNTGTYCFDGYVADFFYIDGQVLSPSDFAMSDANGVWVPARFTGTYGNQGFFLEFKNGAALGTDTSGNGNHWTTSGFTAADQMVDTPTNNFCTLNPLDLFADGAALSNGNLVIAGGGSGFTACRGTMGVTSGKWYFRAKVSGKTNNSPYIGLFPAEYYILSTSTATGATYGGRAWIFRTATSGSPPYAYVQHDQSTTIDTSFVVDNGDYMDFAFDADNGTIWVGRNGVFDGNPDAGTGAIVPGYSGTWVAGKTLVPVAGSYSSSSLELDFQSSPPSSASTFKTLCTANLPAVSIKTPADHFNVVLATGTSIKSSSEALYPSFLEWIKDRANSNNHQLIDTVRGTSAVLQSNTTGTETSYSAPSGMSVGWVWNAGGAAVSNTAGSVTSQVSANPTVGFSIVTWTGTGSNATVGHGLGAAPMMIIAKSRNPSAAEYWPVYHYANGAANFVRLNTDLNSQPGANIWNSTAPTATVFSIGTNTCVNENARNFVAYCFAEIPGYSKFGSFVGNGSPDGTFIYLGFRARYFMWKRTDSAMGWVIFDSVTSTYNAVDKGLYANDPGAEGTIGNGHYIDVMANGVKFRDSIGFINVSGAPYIYAAFAEHPFGGANVAPSPAR